MVLATMPRGAQDSLLDRLAAELSGRLANKAVSGTPQPPYMHGPGGLWSYPGLERPVISTRVVPRGIAGMLPARANNSMNPMYPYLTGFQTVAEVQPNGVCDDPPTTGPMKNCFQTAIFGRYGYQTRVLDITRLGQIVNRAEFTDLMLWNDPLGVQGGNSITTPGTMPGSLNLNNDVSVRFAEVGTSFQNKLMRQVWEGNPANNTSGGGYKEFTGLDMLIGTGHVDAITGVACPTLDSTIVDAGFTAVDDLSPAADSVLNNVVYVYRHLKNLAERTGLAPVRWAFVMREELFYELSAVWPCSYLTYRCIAHQGTVVNLDVGDAITMRDAMRSGSYLVIDGERVDVVVDDGLVEETNADDAVNIPAGSYSSSIKILPLTVQGNKSVLFWEYFAWNGPNAALAAETLAAGPLLGNFFWTDGGIYLWHFKPPTNWCVQWVGLVEPRIILLTPHLAASIDNILYTPLMHTRDAYSDQPNYLNGGNTANTTTEVTWPPSGPVAP